MPFVLILIGLLVVAAIVIALVGVRLLGSVRRLSTVRGVLRANVADRSGMLRARTAALGIAVSDLRQDRMGRRPRVGTPRTIGTSVEREDHRA